MRVCPQCGTRTPSETCPLDGLVTLDEAVLESTDPLLGRLIGGKYRVERHIGSGGMGAVYLARHAETGGLVAVKVMIPDRASRPTAIKRFSLEAQNAAALRHANTVRVLDFGADDDLMFLVMEFLEGESLQDLLERKGRLPWLRAARIARQVLLALWEAHEHTRRIVHRDIKAANVLVCRQVGDDDFVKVVDFGVARSLEGSGAGTQGAIGTPHAMAPEQWSGDADARSDLYSVGCLLYEMLAGRAAFEVPPGAGGGNVLMRYASMHLIEAPPPLRRYAPELPIGLARLVHALLEKRPDDRPQRARDVIGFLDRIFAGDELPELAVAMTRDEATHGVAAPRRHPSSGVRVAVTPPHGPDDDGRGSHDETIDADGFGDALDDADADAGASDDPWAEIATSEQPAAVVLAALQVQPQQAAPGGRRVGTSSQPRPLPRFAAATTPEPAAASVQTMTPRAELMPSAQGARRGPSAMQPLPAVEAPARPAPRAGAGAAAAAAPPAAAKPGAAKPAANGWLAWAALAIVVFGVAGAWLLQRQRAAADDARGQLVDGSFAVQPPPPPEAPAPLPTAAPPATAALAAVAGRGGAAGADLEEAGSRIDEELDGRRPQVTYRAHLGAVDHRSRGGVKLRSAVDVVIQDRVNVHDGHHRDPLDSVDALFASASERARLKRLLQKALGKEVSRRIVAGDVDVEVQVWKDFVQLTMLRR